VNAIKIAVVGSGPAGLSAAAHAAELGVSHVLLEASPAHANTIQRYQKGKLVMAEPGYLPLRSSLSFEIGSREEVLSVWQEGIDDYNVNIRYKTEVKAISGERGSFTLETTDGETLEAEHVVLAIGVQGNPRKLGVEGDSLPIVQYTLDDPDEYQDETIVVIGAGDAAIENALGVANRNKVYIVNRKAEFSRAKRANIDKILAADEEGRLTCLYNSSTQCVEEDPSGENPGIITIKTEVGEQQIPCNRIIARLGAIPPRTFVESCQIEFPSKDVESLPALTTRYESSVPGLYVIGALGGYPLIKQAMNQGYEVVEYIAGNEIRPADHELMVERLASLPYQLDVDYCLELLRDRVPMFTQINPLLFREFMLESKIRLFTQGETIYSVGDYTNTFYTLVDGEVKIGFGEPSSMHTHTVSQGGFFGELSLISGRRRSNTAVAESDCILIEAPRRIMNKLCASIESVRKGIDEIFIARAIQETFTPGLSVDDLRESAHAGQLNHFSPGEAVFREGDEGARIHIVRRGSLTLSRETDQGSRIVGYVPSGEYVGELSVMNVGRYTETACAEVATETISIGRDVLLALIARDKSLVQRVQDNLHARMSTYIEMKSAPVRGDSVRFLMDNGLGEATDVLIINESLCVSCDNCEAACAGTHAGVSRLNREAGPSFAGLHIPTVCRHCEQPHCMNDCPPDAIHRTEAGEVFIDIDTCIGCGNCYSNCPYGVITMVNPAVSSSVGLVPRLLGSIGLGGRRADTTPVGCGVKKAVKCDLCKDLSGGPACVRACPTGAAIRMSPDKFSNLASEVAWEAG
jgi:thioredoxin reductase/Fe-S-cluster-containing hydrogenase component 2